MFQVARIIYVLYAFKFVAFNSVEHVENNTFNIGQKYKEVYTFNY